MVIYTQIIKTLLVTRSMPLVLLRVLTRLLFMAEMQHLGVVNSLENKYLTTDTLDRGSYIPHAKSTFCIFSNES